MFMQILLALFLIFLPVSARPPYLAKYNSHPQKIKKESCGLCHISEYGGGARNKFGDFFELEGKQITNDLIKEFPAKFNH